ncbi:MAG: hypothetical protein MPK31_08505 [Gammaproteobacteria bacterium]|nr:hypothetical protein [Gammaproteobacteria bacterium]
MPLAVAAFLLFQFAQEDIEKNSHADEGENCQDAVSHRRRARLLRRRVFLPLAVVAVVFVDFPHGVNQKNGNAGDGEKGQNVVKGHDASPFSDALKKTQTPNPIASSAATGSSRNIKLMNPMTAMPTPKFLAPARTSSRLYFAHIAPV